MFLAGIQKSVNRQMKDATYYMITMNQNLIHFGFNRSFIESLDAEILEKHEIARIIAVHKDSYTITNGEVDVLAELVGKLVFNASSTTDYPAVGDWVLVNLYDGMTFSIIHEIQPRQSLPKRKTPRAMGSGHAKQLI